MQAPKSHASGRSLSAHHNKEHPTDGAEEDTLYPFYFGKDAGKQQGKLNRTLQSLNPFKKSKAGGGWFNPEEFTAQKREWAKQFSGDGHAPSEHYKIFESFFIAGLPPVTDITSVTADAQTTKTARHDHVHLRFTPEATKETLHRGSRAQPKDAQILYSYPLDKPVSSEVASFCFPHGVNPVLLERTPSMSSLNEIIYGQRFLHSDACSFVFLMKVADNMPLYGICCYMDELVHRPPAILRSLFPEHNAPLSRYLVAAPRCYCLLTHYPFFSLHLKVLHMIMGLERLDRITSFAEEADGQSVPESPFADPDMQNSPVGKPPAARAHGSASLPPSNGPNARLRSSRTLYGELLGTLQGSAEMELPRPPPRPVADAAEAARTRGAVEALAVAIRKASASVPEDQTHREQLGLELQQRPSSFTSSQPGARPLHRRSSSAAGLPPLTPHTSGIEKGIPLRVANSISRASARMRQVLDAQAEAAALRGGDDLNGHGGTSLPDLDIAVESSSDSDTSYRTAHSNVANGAWKGEDLPHFSPARMRKSGSAGALSRSSASSPVLEERAAEQRGDLDHSPSASGQAADARADQAPAERSARNLLKSQSLRPHLAAAARGPGTDPVGALQVMQAYYEAAVPQPGQEFEFSADDSLQPVHYYRPPLQLEPGAPEHVHRTQIANAEADAAAGLRSWTIAVLCRCLSLDNILLLLTAVLLEQQMVLFCPNIGLLSTAVLSLVPLIRPFAWQSLLLPILPALDKMLDLLEAPVPFILGVQYKTSDVASRCGSLIRVNVYKDSIRNAEKLPALPGSTALQSMLEPAYLALKGAGVRYAHGRPTYDVTDAEKQAAEDFLTTTEGYLGGLCAKLDLHTITDVQTPDRVSLLMKDSFIESFEAKDRNFVRMFVETQMFSVYCDTVLR